MRTEGECLKLLRRGDLPEEIFAELLADRGIRRYHAVRAALAAHPRTPRAVALTLVATLFWRDLAHISADARVHPAVRRAADQDLLRRVPEMAVAERVDLARNVGRGTLLQLRFDADPRVVESVLENRFTTEADVVQAVLRAGRDVLEVIAGHPRWTLRLAVRSAILRNPGLSAPLALSFLTRASLEDLRGVRDSPHASPLLKACAERVLAERTAEV
jgi:hypothetical protein